MFEPALSRIQQLVLKFGREFAQAQLDGLEPFFRLTLERHPRETKIAQQVGQGLALLRRQGCIAVSQCLSLLIERPVLPHLIAVGGKFGLTLGVNLPQLGAVHHAVEVADHRPEFFNPVINSLQTHQQLHRLTCLQRRDLGPRLIEQGVELGRYLVQLQVGKIRQFTQRHKALVVIGEKNHCNARRREFL